ncbi:MAG: hypothetical protein DRQ89_15280 [Epsilonproteobacteria bacterium]|nr:MAG: hypothetical protein DRQ89_15280 [Campylobacterota bacterium]
MKDGSVLMGEIVKKENNSLMLTTTYAGTLKIKWDQVRSFESKEPVSILLKSERLISTRYVNNTDKGNSQIKKIGENWKSEFKTDNVSYINPDPWRLNKGYKVSGNIHFALESDHGNTVEQDIDINGKLEFRSLTDRYTLTGILENDTDKGKQSEDNWFFTGKYDRFTTKNRYYGALLSFERDRFDDLELRTIFGPYVGRQFYETHDLNLRLETGLSQVHESNMKSDNDKYLSFNWFIDYDQYFFNKFTQFYHKHNGLWNLENTQRMTLDSRTGFRFPLKSGFVASAELEFDYDNAPKADIGKTDTTYRVKLGYQFE